MRTKTLLLMAGAALALSLATSQAQVYSANIVGYANQVFAGPGLNTACVVPLVGTNVAADTLIGCLQQNDSISIWNGSGYYSDSFTDYGPGYNWFDSFNNYTNAPNLLPGQGFFYTTLSGATSETNTYVGTVQLTNQVNFPNPGANYFVGSTPPIAGSVDNTNFNLPLQQNDVVEIWNGNGFYSDSFTDYGPGYNWFDSFNNYTNAPALGVGQAFFYVTLSGSSEVWTQNLSWVQ